MASAPGPGDPTRLAGARCPLRSWGSRGLGASRASTRAQVPPAQPAPASRDRAAPPCQHHPAQPSWSRRSCRSHQPAELLEDEVKTEVKQVCSCGQASRSRAQSRVCRALFSPFPLKGSRLLTSGTQTVAGRGDRARSSDKLPLQCVGSGTRWSLLESVPVAAAATRQPRDPAAAHSPLL